VRKYAVLVALLAAVLASAAALLAIRHAPLESSGVSTTTPATYQRVASPEKRHCKLRILYYDSLARDIPNQTLVKLLERIAREYNACIDVYLGRQAGIKPILNIGEYDIVVVRAHGGIWDGHGYYIATGLAPGEKLDIPLDLAKRLASQGILAEASPAVFANGGAFVSEKLIIIGSYKLFNIVHPKRGSVLIAMTCSSIQDPLFVSKALKSGLGLYIGWIGAVTPRDIDRVLPKLLKLVLEYYTRGARGCRLASALKQLGPLLMAPDTHAILSSSCLPSTR